MIRRFAIVIAALAFVPASAEAAKMRFNGGKSAATPATAQPAAKGGTAAGIGIGTVSGSRSGSAYAATGNGATDPARVLFPPASTPTPGPSLLRLTAAQDDKIWCRSEIVVGGFCVLN